MQRAVQAVEGPLLRVFTDGSRAGRRAGYGFYVELVPPVPSFAPFVVCGPTPRAPAGVVTAARTSNNRGELYAIVRALEMLYERNGVAAATGLPVRVYSDSMYAINAVTRWAPGWRARGVAGDPSTWRKADGDPVANADLIAALRERFERGEFDMEHVRGHAGVRGNVIADRAANVGSHLDAEAISGIDDF